MSRYRKITIWSATAGLMFASIAIAQQTSLSIRGTVVDEFGSPVPGVVVELSGEALEQGPRSTVTDEQGQYVFEDLPPGPYVLLFTSDSAAPRREEIVVSTGQTLNLVVELAGGRTIEEVIVAGIRGARRDFPRHGYRCKVPLQHQIDSGAAGAPQQLFRPICFLGQAGYAFNAPPGVRYLEEEDLLFRVDPTSTALEAKEDVEGFELRGAVEAATGPWSRCMEAELVETTIGSKLQARNPEKEKLKIRPLIRNENALPGKEWVEATSDNPVVHKMGLHSTDWRWRITGARPGRTQLELRLYAVAVLEKSEPGAPICAPSESREPDGSRRRVRTFQRRLLIDVSAPHWIDARLPSPLLWSLLLPPAGLALAWRRRNRGTPVFSEDNPVSSAD